MKARKSRNNNTMLSIVVLAYHITSDTTLTDECVASIDKQELPEVRIKKWILDNGSIPPLKDYGNSWPVLHKTFNVGNIEGQNECFMASDTEWVLFVSNDVRLEDGCIKALWAERFNGQLMPIILNSVYGGYSYRGKPRWPMSVQSLGGRLVWPGYGFNITKRVCCKDYSIDYVPSICYLMPKELWRRIGWFDPWFPMAYEDVDMGLRLGSSRLKCSNSAFAVHLGNATLGYDNNRRFVEGRIRLINKHYKGLDRVLRLLTVKTLCYIPIHPAKVIR